MKGKVGVVGAGAFGIRHLEAIARIDEMSVVALTESDADKARQVAGHFRVGRVFSQLGKMLERPDIDAVILRTPTPLHAERALACLRAGKHVQVEIPMADNLADAQKLVGELTNGCDSASKKGS